jgi:hypothetical protein
VSAGMTKTQDHALAVIRARGGVVHVVDGEPRIGWNHTSFTVQTVRALAARGHLVREPGEPEAYRVKGGAS